MMNIFVLTQMLGYRAGEDQRDTYISYDSLESPFPSFILGFSSIKLPLEGQAFFLSNPVICASSIDLVVVVVSDFPTFCSPPWEPGSMFPVFMCALSLLVIWPLSVSWRVLASRWEENRSRLKWYWAHVLFQFKQVSREFPGGPVVRIRCFHCRDLGSVPRQETEISQTTQHNQNKFFFLNVVSKPPLPVRNIRAQTGSRLSVCVCVCVCVCVQFSRQLTVGAISYARGTFNCVV